VACAGSAEIAGQTQTAPHADPYTETTTCFGLDPEKQNESDQPSKLILVSRKGLPFVRDTQWRCRISELELHTCMASSDRSRVEEQERQKFDLIPPSPFTKERQA
jgi:hypothetical protein